jgi:hypothetical protein
VSALSFHLLYSFLKINDTKNVSYLLYILRYYVDKVKFVLIENNIKHCTCPTLLVCLQNQYKSAAEIFVLLFIYKSAAEKFVLLFIYKIARKYLSFFLLNKTPRKYSFFCFSKIRQKCLYSLHFLIKSPRK